MLQTSRSLTRSARHCFFIPPSNRGAAAAAVATTSTSTFSTSVKQQLHRPVLFQHPPSSHLKPVPKSNRPQASAARTFRRHCSHRRAMFREEVAGSANPPNGREVLPTNVKPTHYDLTLEPNLSQSKESIYKGNVKIEYDLHTIRP